MLNDFKDDDFDSKIKNEDISVIQFSAAWCGPCKALVPVMTKLYRVHTKLLRTGLLKYLRFLFYYQNLRL